MHSIQYSCVYLVVSLMIVIGNKQSLHHDHSNDIVVLTLETQDQEQDLGEYRCQVTQSQIKDSQFLNDLTAEEFDAKVHTDGAEHSNVQVRLPCDGDFQFVKFGFNDMCYYFHNIMCIFITTMMMMMNIDYQCHYFWIIQMIFIMTLS